MKTQTKRELGKFEKAPSEEQLLAIVEFFESRVTDSGRVNFTQKEMLEHPIIQPHFKSASPLTAVLTYITNEGYAKKVEVGARYAGSIWDVRKLLRDYEELPTKEVLGSATPKRDEYGNLIVPTETSANVEVEVIKEEERKDEEVKTVVMESPKKKFNVQVLEEIHESMNDMIGYLQTLPVEMGEQLRSLSEKLELVDESKVQLLERENEELSNTLQRLRQDHTKRIQDLNKQKEDLEAEVQNLKKQLEEAIGKPNFNTTMVYRQRNLILDEVDRVLHEPAWRIRQNKEAYRKSIVDKLDTIMKEIGVKEE